MKKLVCGCFGTIYYATILKEGVMSDRGRVDVTDDAINAVTDHIMIMDTYQEKGYGGYSFSKKNGGKIQLCLFDGDKYKLVKREEE